MGIIPQLEAQPQTRTPKCLARSVLDALAQNPSLEAVTINRQRQTISVATLGQTDVPRLTEQISSTIQVAPATDSASSCNLLDGAGDCLTCDRPPSEQELRRVNIQHDADSIT